MARIYQTREPARVALPDGWEWRIYGARHIATGRCVCWAPQAARWVVDSVVGNFSSLGAALAAAS